MTGDQVVQAIGLQGVNPRGLKAMGFPRLDITGVTTLRVNPGGVALDRNAYSYADSVTWSAGSHVVKFGGELKTFRDFNSANKRKVQEVLDNPFAPRTDLVEDGRIVSFGGQQNRSRDPERLTDPSKDYEVPDWSEVERMQSPKENLR